jgi:hypothetical protein
VRAVPRLCEFYPGICRTTEDKARKNLSQGSRRVPAGTMKIHKHTKRIHRHNNKNIWIKGVMFRKTPVCSPSLLFFSKHIMRIMHMVYGFLKFYLSSNQVSSVSDVMSVGHRITISFWFIITIPLMNASLPLWITYGCCRAKKYLWSKRIQLEFRCFTSLALLETSSRVTTEAFHLPRLEIWRHVRGDGMEECK